MTKYDQTQIFRSRFSIVGQPPSVPLFIEYKAKCSIQEHWIAGGLTEKEVTLFVDTLAVLVKPIKTHFLWRPTLRDPNDEMVLEVAMNGQADAIVTFNQNDFKAVKDSFDIELILPSTALRRICNG